MTRLEIAAESLEDAIRAQEGGADSVEFSVDLSVGGLTPPLDVVRAAREALHIDIHAIIRPHARDFIYSAPEIDLILAHTRHFAASGITGVVFGAQTPDGRLDIPLIRRVAGAARGVILTVHRAIDTAADADSALEALAESGIAPRVLTAGPAPTAWEGRAGLRRWVARFGKRIRFVASGGLKLEYLADYAAFTGVHEVHLGGAARVGGRVDAESVRALRAVLSAK